MIQAFVTFMVLAACPPSQRLEAVYATARRYDKTTFKYVPPTKDALARMQALIAQLARATAKGQPVTALVPRATALGFELGPACDDRGTLVVLREAGPARAGGGLFVFRPNGAPLCVQAPHSFFDQGTGELAMAAFTGLQASCLFVNTVHRHAPSDQGQHQADVAHAERTMFHAATLGLLDAAKIPIAQLHGFGPRPDVPGDVAAIVSDGAAARDKSAPAARLRDALRGKLTGPARVYGEDAHVLGATTNIQGKAARARGAPFVHVELSAPARVRLKSDPAPLVEALRALLGRR